MLKSYNLQKLPSGTANYAMYDDGVRLTDAELDALFDTAGSATVYFDPVSTSTDSSIYIRYNNDSDMVLQINLPSGERPPVQGKDYVLSWGDKPASGIHSSTSIVRVEGKTISNDELSFLMSQIKSICPVGAVFTSTSATAPTIAGGTWTEIGTQTVGSSTVHYYERTA